ncbi:MAG: hypothetical protein AB8H86_20050, partial [Polyangiales bacterium]
AGLSIQVEATTQPGLRLESSRSRRLRLVAGGEPVFWARIENGYYGVWALRGETKPAVVRAIRADEARALRDIEAWMRWFAQELLASDASPLGVGTWHLTELVPKPSSIWSDLLVPQHGDGLPGPAFDLFSSLDRALITYEDWGSNGSAGVIPLRRRSPSDAGRVKSWLKHARDETLPPILLWWVGALDAHLILDGHDRLTAALEAGVTPKVLTLWQSIDEPVDVDDKAQAHFVENYLQLFDNPNVELMARRQLNAKLIAKYRDISRRRITRAKANPALDETWDAEVRALAPADSDDLEDMLRDD